MDFRAWQYYDCTSLKTPADEVYPSTITSTGNSFRQHEYLACVLLGSKAIPIEHGTFGDDKRLNQYQHTKINGDVNINCNINCNIEKQY
jgi:hypothetical protein